MSEDRTVPKVAVVCDKRGEQAQAVTDWLQARGLTDAAWFAPRDVDDVDEAVREGRIEHVVFADLNGLLEAVWDEEIRFGEWLSAKTEVSFANAPEGAPPAPSTIVAVFRSWQKWQRRRRRRQVVAGAVLSAIALGAGFLMTLTLP